MFKQLYGILLNGTSSAGKTSIADAIIQRSELPFVRLELDRFLEMIAFRHIDCEAIDGVNDVCERLVIGYHNSIEGMICAGNLVLVDHVLQELTWRKSFLSIHSRTPLLRVCVTCPQAELSRRELTRCDRPCGLALMQIDRVHQQVEYDLTVDTMQLLAPV